MRATAKAILGVLASLAILAAGLNHAHAAVPARINYQGYLTNAVGQPVNGTVNLVLTLYATPDGGSALWSEFQGGVSVSNGVFSVMIGAVDALTLPFDVPYYLGVTVNPPGAELTPRTPLASAPYSLRALKAESVADNAITASAIADQSIPPSKLSGPTCFNGEVLRFNGTQWTCVPQFVGVLPNPPENDTFLTYNSITGGAGWRKPSLQCVPTTASAEFAIGATGYVTAFCPAGRSATGGSFSSGNSYGLQINLGLDFANCYFWNNSGGPQTFACAVQCCSIVF